MASIRIVIELNERGEVTVNGPLHDRVLFFGLLEVARDVVREAPRPELSRILPATLAPRLPDPRAGALRIPPRG